jgi:hypothetical protein
MTKPREIHLIDKQVVRDIMHNVEKDYNVHNIKQDATDAFLHLWEELEKVFFPERMLDEDDNSDIIDIAEGRESYGGTTDD